MAAILTYAEQRDGALRRASLEAVSEARRLADAEGASVESVVIGSGVAGLAAASAFLLLRYRLNSAWLVLGGGVIGVAARWLR